MISRKLGILSICILIGLMSCVAHNSIYEDAPAITTATSDLSGTPEVTLSGILIPTISIDHELNIVELLKSSDCVSPCYLGITPGKTKWSDAETLLETLGAVYVGKNKETDLVTFGYSIWLDAHLQNDQKIFQDLGFVVSEDIVQQISVSLQTHEFVSKFQEYWSRYSPRDIFLQLDMPDAIYSTNGGGLALVYANQGAVYLYDSFRRENLFCPQVEKGAAIRRFVFTNLNFPLSIYQPFEDVSKNHAIWSSIQESLGIDAREFYNRLLADSTVCFEMK
jgi:hypothetical protein